jgi:hypothetical protein
MNEELTALNSKLTEISQRVFGDKLQLLVVDPAALVPTRKNARYMPKEVFDQLMSNVKGDGGLQSVPLCHKLEDGRIELLSGNHRVKAACEAGIKEIIILCFPYELKTGKKRAVQLSHNAIVGNDDMQLLVELWGEIDEISDRIYSGLDSKTIGEMAKVNFSGFGAEQVRTECVVLWFLPDEVQKMDALVAKMTELTGASVVYMAPLAKYETLFKAIMEKKQRDNIKNTAVAMSALIDGLTEHLAATKPAPIDDAPPSNV